MDSIETNQKNTDIISLDDVNNGVDTSFENDYNIEDAGFVSANSYDREDGSTFELKPEDYTGLEPYKDRTVADYLAKTQNLDKSFQVSKNLKWSLKVGAGYDVSPEELGKLKDYADTKQIPESAMLGNPQAVLEHFKIKDIYDKVTEKNDDGSLKNPITASVLRSPKLAATFYDKADALTKIEEIKLRESSPLYKGYFKVKSSIDDILSSALGNTQSAFELMRRHPTELTNLAPGASKLLVAFADALPDKQANTFIQGLQKGREYFKQNMTLDDTGFSKFAYDLVGFLPIIGASFLSGGLAANYAGEALATTAGKVAAERGAGAFFGSYIFGSDYGKFRDEGISPERASTAALGDAIVQSYMQKLNIGAMFNMFKATGVSNILKKGVQNMITQFGVGEGMAIPQAMSSIWAEAKVKGYTPEEQASIFVDNLGSTLKSGAYSGLLMATMGAVTMGGSLADYRRGIINNRKTLAERAKIISEHRLAERGVKDTADFSNATSDINKVYISPDKLNTILGEHFENDTQKMSDVIKSLKLTDDIKKARADNTDVPIDTGKMLSALSEDQELVNKISDNVGFTVGGENAQEAATALEKDKKEQKAVDESKTIRVFKEKLRKKTKLSESQINAAGSFLNNYANVAAENFGVAKEDYLKQLNLKFKTIDKGDRIGKIGGKTDTINRTVTLFQDADMKTVIHEMAHLFKGELDNAAKLKSAPEYIKEDLKKLDEFTKGLNEYDAHEKIAEAMTKYIQEGKAPNKELKTAFRRSQKWLLDIYKKTKGTIGGDTVLNDEVRGVFDRLLSTQEELDKMEKTSLDTEIDKGISDIVNDKGADEELAKIYNEAREEAIRGEVKRAQKEYAKTVEKTPEMIKRIKHDVESEGMYRAIDQVAKNGGLNPSVIAEFSDRNVIDDFRKHKGFINKNAPVGTTVLEDAVAENNTGFDRPDEFLDKVRNMNDKTTEIRERVAKEKEYLVNSVEEELRGKEGFISKEEQIFNDKRVDYVVKRANILANKISKDTGESVKRLNKRILERTAAQELGKLALRDTSANKYIKMSEKHARLADEALKEKDVDKARELIKRQAANLIYAREAYKIARRAKTLIQKTKSYAGIKAKAIDSQYHNMLIDVANRLGLSKKKLRPGELRDKAKILKEIKENDLLDYNSNKIIEGKGNYNIKDLSSQQIAEIQTDLDIIARHGKDKVDIAKFLSKAFPGKTINDLLEVSTASMKKVKPKKQYLKGIRQITGAYIEHIIPMLQELDGFQRLKDGTPGINELLIRRPLEEKLGNLYDNRKAIKELIAPDEKILRGLVKRIGNGFNGKPIEGVELPSLYKATHKSFISGKEPSGFNAEKRIAVVFNYMNLGNRNALKVGWGIDEPMAMKIMETLNANELRAIQHMVDVKESLFPSLNDTFKKLNSADLEQIEPAPFDVMSADGELVHMKGGYHPIAVDFATKNLTSKELEEYMQLNKKASVYGDRAPSASAIKERKFKSSPVLLTLNPYYTNLEETLRYTHLAGVVTDILSVIGKPEWREQAVRIIGKDKYDVLVEKIKDIGMPPRTKPALWEKVLQSSQSLYTISKLGNKATTALKQVGSIFSAAQEDPASILYGLAFMGKNIAKNPLTGIIDSYNFAKEKSSFIREKGSNIEMGMERKDRFSLKGVPSFDIPIGKGKHYTVTPTDMRDVAMSSIKAMDAFTVGIVWNGKYQHELAKGTKPAEAVKLANEQVADTQPVFTELYRNLWQKGGKNGSAAGKMLTWVLMPFTGWTAKAHTRNSIYWRAFLNGQIPFSKYSQHIVLERVIAPLAVNLAVSMLLSGNKKDDLGKELVSLGAYNISGIPGLNAVAAGLMYKDKFARRELPISDPVVYLTRAISAMQTGHLKTAGLNLTKIVDFSLGTAGANAINSYKQIKDLIEKK